MTTTLTIRNIRGVAAADLDLSGPITAVFGPNGSGKSSVALALAACLTGNVSPISLKARGADKAMTRDGEPKGVAVLTEGDARALIEWPKGESKTLGTPPRSSAAAAGLVSMVTLADKERAAAFAELFQTKPSREDLDAALAEQGSERPSGDKLWQYIEQMGWDAATGAASDSAKQLKGSWREVTGGATWGSDVGQTWRPADWSMDLDVVEEAELERDVEEAREAGRQAVASQAVAGERRAELERHAGLAATAARQLGKLEPEMAEARAELAAAEQARAALPGSGDQAGALLTGRCPECGAEPLRFPRPLPAGQSRVELVKVEPLSDEDLKQRRLAIAGADGAVERARGKVGEIEGRVRSARQDADLAARAKAELEKLGASDDGPVDHQADGALQRAEAALAMWRQQRRAAQLHQEIVRQVAIAAACGPAGARKRKLEAVLGEINAALADLSAAMGCHAVVFNGDLDVFMGRRAYQALSASEQWRCRVLVQLEVARRDGSAMVVCDGADILDGRGRNGLAAALQRAGTKALVAMTVNAPSRDMFAAAGLGRSYWMEGSRAVPMDEAFAAAQQGKAA